MVIVDTHCHASPYWYAPVESLLHEMSRAGVDKALLVQIGGIYDNSYLIECMRRFPGRFSVVAMVDTDLPDAPQRLEPVPAGHHDVEDHEVGGGAALEQGQGAAPILGRVDVVARHLEQVGQVAAHALGVVDHQHARPARGLLAGGAPGFRPLRH